MAKKNKSAEFGIYILTISALLAIFSYVFLKGNELFNIGSLDQVHLFIEMTIYSGFLISSLSFLIGLSSLAYNPKKLSVFLILASGIGFIMNSFTIISSVVS